MDRALRERYDALQDQLDNIQEQRRQEWEDFASHPSLPVPEEADCDALHEHSERTMAALQAHSNHDDDDDDDKDGEVPFPPHITPGHFGSGRAYAPILRSTQDPQFFGDLVATYTPTNISNNTPHITSTPAAINSFSETSTLDQILDEDRARLRLSKLMSTATSTSIDSDTTSEQSATESSTLCKSEESEEEQFEHISCGPCWTAEGRETCKGGKPPFTEPCNRCRDRVLQCEPRVDQDK